MTIAIEMSTGRVIEVSQRVDAASGVVPSDVPDHSVRYAVSIVDGVPEQ